MYSSQSHKAASYTTLFHGNHVEWFDSNCSAAPTVCLNQPCPCRSWPTLGSWLPPQCCTCWARLDAEALCRPGPDCTAAYREGTHPPPEGVQNKQVHKHTRRHTHMVTKPTDFFNISFISEFAFWEFSLKLYYWMLFLQQMTVCWLQLPDASSQGWAENPPRSEGHPGGWLLHRLQASPAIRHMQKKQVQKHIHTSKGFIMVHEKGFKCLYTCGGHCGELSSP